MHSRLHIMPLIHLKRVVSNGGRQVSSCITVKSITIRKLGLVVVTIGLDEASYVPPWLLDGLFNSIHHTEVRSLRSGTQYVHLGSAGDFRKHN